MDLIFIVLMTPIIPLGIISAFGLLALVGAFVLMSRSEKKGFGPNNLRVIGIILVATFATVLALHDSNSITAAMGILGAIAGYLFGAKDSSL